MPYTSTPEQSTYNTSRFSFIGDLDAMDGRDLRQQRIVNMMPEISTDMATQEKTYYVKKRPGLQSYAVFPAGVARGVFNWMDHLITVIDNLVYFDNVFLFGMPTSTGSIGFCPYFGQTFGQALILVDGISGWVIRPDKSVTFINDPNFPTPHVPSPVFIDEYLILTKAGTQDFYQSMLDDPMTWVPGDFNTAEMYPDLTVAMTQFKNYIVVGGKQSIEFFYDSGAPDGTSFQRSEAVVQQIGVLVPETLKTTEEDIIFIGETKEGGKSVWIIEKFKANDIGTTAVRQAIDAEGPSIASASGFVVRVSGHQLYILNLTDRTFVYDFEIKMWHEWAYDGSAFNFRYATFSSSNNPLILHNNNGNVYSLDQFAYDDSGIPIDCLVQTDQITFKSFNRKMWIRLSVMSEQDAGADSYINISWSEDNFSTFNGPRMLKLNAALPAIYKMGMSRTRSLRFSFNEPRPLRLQYYEIDYNATLH